MLVLAVLATPSHAASRPRPRRGGALIDTRNRTDFHIKLETDAPALALAASASRKPNKAAELLLHQDVLGDGWALFGAWPVVGTFHPTFSYPFNHSKFSGAASRAAAPATFKPIGAAADAELDPIKGSGSTSNTTGCTTAAAFSKIEADETATKIDAASLLFLHPWAAVLALLLAACLEPLLRGQVKNVEGRSHAAISVPLLSSACALRVGFVTLFFLKGVCGNPAAPLQTVNVSSPCSLTDGGSCAPSPKLPADHAWQRWLVRERPQPWNWPASCPSPYPPGPIDRPCLDHRIDAERGWYCARHARCRTHSNESSKTYKSSRLAMTAWPPCSLPEDRAQLLSDVIAGRVTLSSRNDFAWLLAAVDVRGAAVEVGVADGEFSSMVLAGWRGCTQYTQVDPWFDKVTAAQRFGKNAKLVTMTDQSHLGSQLCSVRTHFRHARYSGKVRQLRMLSADAAAHITDSSLAFVYIDGDHYFRGVQEDLRMYWPKLRPGGLIAGHDFEWPWLTNGGPDTWRASRTGGVKAALEQFVRDQGLTYHVTHRMVHPGCCPSWYLFKPQA